MVIILAGPEFNKNMHDVMTIEIDFGPPKGHLMTITNKAKHNA